MATPPPPLHLEDQTNEEFFDKAVDDYGAAQSRSKYEDLSSELPNLSLKDVVNPVPASEVNDSKDNQSLDFFEASKNEASIGDAQSNNLFEGASGGRKGVSAKLVQWSALRASSQQFGQVDFDSDSFLGSGNGKLVISQAFSELKSNLIENKADYISSSVGSYDQQIAQPYISVSEHSADLTEVPNWENLYPGWKYDSITGQWCQLDGYDATTNTQSDFNMSSSNTHECGEAKVQNAFEQSILARSDSQQASHSVLESISEESSALNSWNQVSQGSLNYPPNMVFDPQYPEWYYDTITQMWYTLDSYFHTRDASSATQDQQTNKENAFTGSKIDGQHVSFGSHAQSGQFKIHEQSSQKSHGSANASDLGKQSIWQQWNCQEGHWNASGSGYGLQSMCQEQTDQECNRQASGSGYDQQKMWQPGLFLKNGAVASFSNDQLTRSYNDSLKYSGSHQDKQLNSNNLEPLSKHNYVTSVMTVPQGYVTESMNQFTQTNMDHSLPSHLSNVNYGTESSINYTQHSFYGANPSYSQFSYTPNEGRSTAGRPPHALVSFGFGGKFLVMKNLNFSSSIFDSGSKGAVGCVVLIYSLVDVVMDKTNFLNTSITGGFGYIHTLCQQSFPGPLGGNTSSKDVNKWMDDRMMSSESSIMDFQNGLPLRLLLSLLKVLCQHYGKLRSPYGIELSLKGCDSPELAVSKLFASAKRKDTSFGGFGSSMHCIKNVPSEEEIRATAIKVQNLLLSGRNKEALQCAQEGQLWGLALVLAAQFGDQFYSDTVKQMAIRQFVCGSPLRTLCLLIAGQPADVFSTDSSSGISGSANGHYHSAQVIPNTMLDDWQENLAIITSNRTKDDELVIIHLGDCLWKERGDVTAAHICYLVAEANFEQYSDSARLCLIGVDHMKNPRTYACPDAIQRTETYEYSKIIGNSQFVLLPFQPYKLVYAYMLAEVGKVSDSLRYCQASMKMLKNSGRSPELELWRTLFSSLEERLKTHLQGGYGTNLVPTILVGKLFDSIDRSIHRIIGSPPLPPTQQNGGDGIDNNSLFQKVSNSQSTMAITSLISSPSIEAMREGTVNSSWKVTHNRSVSEPDFGRSSKPNSTKNGGVYKQGNASMPDERSRFGRFGSHLLQKTVGWMTWSRHERQAKLGESNKFYYDEKLKRWVEEGAELPPAEASLPPPPTAVLFQKSISNYDVKNALNCNSLSTDAQPGLKLDAPSEQKFCFPTVPPSQNQFSAHSRIGVRSRYVDTFNKGSGSFTSSFQSPSASSVNPLSGANFFVPTASTNYNKTNEAIIADEASTSTVNGSPPPSFSSMQRFPSMDDIVSSRTLSNDNGSLSRSRAASWCGAHAAISNAKEAVWTKQHSFVASHIRSGSAMDEIH